MSAADRALDVEFAAVAAVDLLAEHIERTIDTLQRHADGLGIEGRAELAEPMAAIEDQAAEMRARVGRLTTRLAEAREAAAVVAEAERAIRGGER